MSFYEIWDYRTGNLLGSFPTEDEALALVRTLAATQDAEAGENLGLSWGDEADEEQGGLIAEGATLVQRARAAA